MWSYIVVALLAWLGILCVIGAMCKAADKPWPKRVDDQPQPGTGRVWTHENGWEWR